MRINFEYKDIYWKFIGRKYEINEWMNEWKNNSDNKKLINFNN